MALYATLQLVVLGMIDPSGLLALGLTGLASFALTLDERAHSREHEAEADESGLAICARACFSKDAAMTAMAKLQKAAGNEAKRHAGWLDTHPAEQDRIAALQLAAAEATKKANADAALGIVSHCEETKGSLWRALVGVGRSKEDQSPRQQQ